MTIAVFYPGNSLMHQVSNWVGKHAGCEFQLFFPESVSEIRELLRDTAISIVDATEDPAQAMGAFVYLLAQTESDTVAVYTEKMHEDLELFVRSRGALLLLGPLGNAAWEGLFEAMRQCLDRQHGFRFPQRQPSEQDARLAAAWLQKDRLKNLLNDRFRKIA